MDVGKPFDYLKAKLDRSKEDLDDARDLFEQGKSQEWDVPLPNSVNESSQIPTANHKLRLPIYRKYFHVPRDIFEPKFALGFDGEMVVYPVCR